MKKRYPEPTELVVVVIHAHTIKYIKHHFDEAPEEGDIISLMTDRTSQDWIIIKTFPEHLNATMHAIMTLMTRPVFANTHTILVPQ